MSQEPNNSALEIIQSQLGEILDRQANMIARLDRIQATQARDAKTLRESKKKRTGLPVSYNGSLRGFVS